MEYSGSLSGMGGMVMGCMDESPDGLRYRSRCKKEKKHLSEYAKALQTVCGHKIECVVLSYSHWFMHEFRLLEVFSVQLDSGQCPNLKVGIVRM